MKVRHALLTALLLATSFAVAQQNPVAESALHQRADTASGMDCVRLGMQAARQDLEDANHYFGAGDVKAAHAAIDLSLHYARRSVDCSLQSHKGEKPAEINLRTLIRRMKDVMQTLDSEDRHHLAQSLAELEKQRDRLLRGIFGPAVGGTPEKKP
jgi:hypothetical protein